jgi:hypothetical protein
LLLLLFFLPFTWGRHRCARATTALPRATSLELLILFDTTIQPAMMARSYWRRENVKLFVAKNLDACFQTFTLPRRNISYFKQHR